MFDVVAIGTATRDVFLRSNAFNVLKDPQHLRTLGIEGEATCFALGSKIDIEEPLFTTGGGATNTAVTFARQGLTTGAVLSIGKDQAGKDIIDELHKEKVTVFASVSDKYRTAYSTLLLSPNGERTVLVYRGAADDLHLPSIPFGKIKTKWVYIAPGAISLEVIEGLVEHFTKQGAKIALNPSGHEVRLGLKALEPILKHVSILNVNQEEAAALTGLAHTGSISQARSISSVVKGIIVITDGPAGSVVYDGETMLKAGIFKERQLVDRTGAGDAFCSGFVAGYMHSNDLRYAIRLASANATAKVEHHGAKGGLLTKKEFETDPRWAESEIQIQTV